MTPLPEVDNFVQITTFAMAAGVGLALCLLYDLFRIARLLRPPSKTGLFVQDVLYWLVSAVVVFCFLLVRCDGGIRFYAMLGLVLGWLACHLTVSRWMMRLSRRLVRALRGVARWIKRHFFRPIARLLRGIGRICVKLLKKMLHLLKKIPKFFKKCLQRHNKVVYNQHSLDGEECTFPSSGQNGGHPPDDVNYQRGPGHHESRRKKKEKRKPVH